MKLVLAVFLIRLVTETAGKKTNKENNKATNKDTSNTLHPAAFALR